MSITYLDLPALYSKAQRPGDYISVSKITLMKTDFNLLLMSRGREEGKICRFNVNFEAVCMVLSTLKAFPPITVYDS